MTASASFPPENSAYSRLSNSSSDKSAGSVRFSSVLAASPQSVSDSTSTAGISAFSEIIDWLPSVKVSANTGVTAIVADITILNAHETVFLKHFFFILPPFLSLIHDLLRLDSFVLFF